MEEVIDREDECSEWPAEEELREAVVEIGAPPRSGCDAVEEDSCLRAGMFVLLR